MITMSKIAPCTMLRCRVLVACVFQHTMQKFGEGEERSWLHLLAMAKRGGVSEVSGTHVHILWARDASSAHMHVPHKRNISFNN